MQVEKQDGQRIKLVEPLVNIFFTLAIIIWFNFFPDTVGYFITATDPASFTPVLSSAFWNYLLLLDIWWGVSILLNVGHIMTGRWTLVTRVADILISLYGISVLIALITGPSFIILPWLSIIIKVILGFAALGLTVGVILQLLRLVKAVLSSGKIA